jgi:hypothetical protein
MIKFFGVQGFLKVKSTFLLSRRHPYDLYEYLITELTITLPISDLSEKIQNSSLCISRNINEALNDVYLRCPRDWTIKGYNDPSEESTAEVFDTRTDEKFTLDCKKNYVVNQSEAYKYYKFNFARNNGNAAFLVIRELILYGSETN